MNAWRVLAGALHYEFVMQVRRWSVWITMLLVSSLTLLAGANEWQNFVIFPGKAVAILWALHANFLLPVGFGVIVSDRLVRDRRTNVEAVLHAVPGSALARLWGKFLGTTLATTLPLVLVYLGGIGSIFARSHDPHVLWWALPAFAAINLPGLLCVGAFSLALPVVLGVSLYQVLFVGYYLWGNDLPLTVGIPTLSHTLLTPAGEYRAGGFFGIADPPFMPPSLMRCSALSSCWWEWPSPSLVSGAIWSGNRLASSATRSSRGAEPARCGACMSGPAGLS